MCRLHPLDGVEDRREDGQCGRVEGPSPRTLTARETQVVRYIADGLSNGQIAARLVLSVRTVESHINRITRKTGAVGRHEIAKLARI